jgi:flagellin
MVLYQTAKLWGIRDNLLDNTETATQIDTAIDALNKQREIVLKMSDVIITALNNTDIDAGDSSAARAAKTEYRNQLRAYAEEIDDIADTTEYNGETLLDGTFTNAPLKYDDFGDSPTGVSLQVGARTKDLKEYDFDYSGVWADNDIKEKAIGALTADINATATGLGLVKNTVNLSTQKTANAAIDKIDNAINKVSMIRATFGSIQNRLEHKIDNLNQTDENLTAAESRIRDTDMAEEVMKLTKAQILSQSSQAMLSQANQLPQSVLSLLQG